MGLSRYAQGTGAQSSPDGAAEPRMKATMYFAYGRDARAGIKSRTTFDAILAGERTSTTRFACWQGYQRWTKVKAGDRVRFFADRDMRGRFVDVIVESVTPINLATCSDEQLEDWSKAEGWSPSYGRGSGERHGPGLQIRYRLAGTTGYRQEA